MMPFLNKNMVKKVFFTWIFITISIGVAASQSPNYVDSLSPPEIESPIYDGAKIVGVYGFVPNAEITIYANDSEEIGKGSFWFSRCAFELNRELNEGEYITAVQTIKGNTSYSSRKPIYVQKLPADVLKNESLGKPTIIPPLYDCQQIVPVKDILPGAMLYITSNGTNHLIGRGETPYNHAEIGTFRLNEYDRIQANQTIGRHFKSPLSKEEVVQGKPESLPTPVVENESLIDGGNTVVLHNLTIGADVDIFSNGGRIGGGVAPGGRVIFPINPPLKKGDKITAMQMLCELKSDPSPTEVVGDHLDAPILEDPICSGSDQVVICDVVPNAILTIYINGQQKGQGASGLKNCTSLYVGDSIKLKDGDRVNITQTIGNVVSEASNTVIVGSMSDPIAKIENGSPFPFAASGHEGELVFLRGVLTTDKYGPVFKATMCGAEGVSVDIIDPSGVQIETIHLDEGIKGHFEGGWNWEHAGWKIPDDIPVGEYKAKFRIYGGTGMQELERFFYVNGIPSGWKNLDPVLVKGNPNSGFIDVVFIPNVDYKGAMKTFDDDVINLINDRFFTLDKATAGSVPSNYKDRFNFYIYTGGYGYRTDIWNLPANIWTDAPGTDVAAILKNGNCCVGETSAFGPPSWLHTPARNGAVTIHEFGHGIWGLVDEYCGDTNYDCTPCANPTNVYSTLTDCQNDAAHQGWVYGDSTQILYDNISTPGIDCQKNLWRYDNTSCLMGDGWDYFGEACSRRISWVFNNWPAGRTKGILVNLRVTKNNTTVLSSEVVAGHPDLGLQRGTLEVKVFSANREVTNRFKLSDPRIGVGDDIVFDEHGNPHRIGKIVSHDNVNFTLIVPFQKGIRRLTITNTTTNEVMVKVNLTDTLRRYCISSNYSEPECIEFRREEPR